MDNTSKTILGVIVVAAAIGGIYYLTAADKAGPLNLPPQGSNQPNAPVARTRSAESVSQSTALLNGEVNPNGAQTSFWYEYGKTESLGFRTSAQLLGAGYTNFSAPAVVTGLSSNTTYFFRVAAQNQHGIVYGSVLSFTTSSTPPPRAGIPPISQALVASAITQTTANLNGTINPNGYQTYYWFEYGKSPGFGNVTPVQSAGSGSEGVSVSAPVSNLDANTTFYFRLNAQNVWGTVNGPIFSFTTAAPNPPQSQGKPPLADTDIAGFVTRNTATLNGRVNPLGSATMYWFEYGRAPLPGSFDLSSKTTARSAGVGNASVMVSSPLTNLASSTTYYYRVVAENQHGQNFGAILNFTTPR